MDDDSSPNAEDNSSQREDFVDKNKLPTADMPGLDDEIIIYPKD